VSARQWAAIAIAAAAAAIVALLRSGVEANGRLVHLDTSVTNWVVDHRPGWLVDTMKVVTRLADVRVAFPVVAVAVIVLVMRRRLSLAVALVASTVGTSLLVHWGKLSVERPRPPVDVQLVSARGFAFPSGHAGQGVALYCGLAVVIWFCTRRRSARVAAAILGGCLALAVGASRVVLGVHWTSDVVAGWAVGVGWLALIVVAVMWWSARSTERDGEPGSGHDPSRRQIEA
jgi:membrane-associated phospholipid phosphatase